MFTILNASRRTLESIVAGNGYTHRQIAAMSIYQLRRIVWKDCEPDRIDDSTDLMEA